VYKIKGADKICLITDAIRACGYPDGSKSIIGSIKNGKPIIVEDGVAKMPDRQSFAGSVATFDRLFKVMLSVLDGDIVNVVKMCSTTPAKLIGLTDRGDISVGKRADLLIVDKDYDIKTIIFGGRII
jgi:N-acetylglucosamine-6-phosphate deacetylase